jgi:predicted small lipoprotein YifL
MILKKLVQFTAVDVLLLGALISLTGCESKGPAEQAGAQIDKGVQNAKDAINPPGPLEKAGRAIDKAAEK